MRDGAAGRSDGRGGHAGARVRGARAAGRGRECVSVVAAGAPAEYGVCFGGEDCGGCFDGDVVREMRGRLDGGVEVQEDEERKWCIVFWDTLRLLANVHGMY